jgi:hypothetical protein
MRDNSETSESTPEVGPDAISPTITGGDCSKLRLSFLSQAGLGESEAFYKHPDHRLSRRRLIARARFLLRHDGAEGRLKGSLS